MTTIGVTGHQSIPDEARDYVIAGIKDFLMHQETPLVGLSSLAKGADQLFAHQILAAGGILQAIIPSQGYETTFPESDRPRYLELRNQAARAEVLNYAQPSEEAFDAAGHKIVELCDVMVAVWDGKAAKGQGGTGDAVEYARKNGNRFTSSGPQE